MVRLNRCTRIRKRFFAFKRCLGKQCLTVICNESPAERFLTLKEDYGEVVFVNLPQVTRIGDNLILHPYQLIVVETTKKIVEFFVGIVYNNSINNEERVML